MRIINNYIVTSSLKMMRGTNKHDMHSRLYRLVFKFKDPTICRRDFYSVLNPFTWVCRIGGIFPLKLEGSVGERKYSTSYGLIIYSLIVLALTVTGLYAWTSETNERRLQLSQNAVVRISLNFEVAIEICSMVLLVATAILNKDKFANAIDSLSSQDILLRKLGTKLDYAADSKKHYIQLGITTLIVVVLCTYDFTYQLNFNLNHPLNWMSWLCPNIIRIANACLFMDVVILLKQRFAVLNDYLRQMIEETKHSPPAIISTSEIICEKIRSIAMIHGGLCEAVLSVNQTFSWNIIAGVIYALIILTTFIYYIIQELRSPYCSYVQLIGYINWATISSGYIITTVTACHFAQEQASLTGKLIHRFQISEVDTPLNDMIKSFSLQLYHEKIKFTGAGLFPLDATLIQSIVGAVTTYLVILIQFDA